jgi:hypothetical protein
MRRFRTIDKTVVGTMDVTVDKNNSGTIAETIDETMLNNRLSIAKLLLQLSL